MAMARIEIEQTGGSQWEAEVEAGIADARRVTVAAASFDEVLAAIADAYRGLMPAITAGHAERIVADVMGQAEADHAASLPAQAQAMSARLQREADAIKAREAVETGDDPQHGLRPPRRAR